MWSLHMMDLSNKPGESVCVKSMAELLILFCVIK